MSEVITIKCDFCGKEITKDQKGNSMPFERTKRGIVHQMVLTIANLPDGYDICRHCVIDIAKAMDDRPMEVIEAEIQEPLVPTMRTRKPTRTTGMRNLLLNLMKKYPEFMTSESVHALMRQTYPQYTGNRSCVLTAMARLHLEGLIEKRFRAGSFVEKEYKIKAPEQPVTSY